MRLLAFPEAWVPAYPFWCDTGSFSKFNYEPAKKLQARLRRNSLAVGSPEMSRLCAAARQARLAVVLGANEREERSGSLYNTLFFLSSSGALLGRHRKLVPTHGERLIWGAGDACGLRPYTDGGIRFGGLICWEHWMPPARQVLHAEGEVFHAAAWPEGGEIHQIASRHYAFEGRCFVLAAASYLTRAAIPADFELAEDLPQVPEVIKNGGSAIIAPDGQYIRGPVFGREELVVAEVDAERACEEKLTLDVAGHYSRPDVFELRVNRRPAAQVKEARAKQPGKGSKARK